MNEPELNDAFYEPFDQDRWLPEPPWRQDTPAVQAWEAAHGHDVRLKCYVEYGCQVIEPTLDRRIAELEAENTVLLQFDAATQAYQAENEWLRGIVQKEAVRAERLRAALGEAWKLLSEERDYSDKSWQAERILAAALSEEPDDITSSEEPA